MKTIYTLSGYFSGYTNITTIMNGNVSPTRLIKSKFIQGPLQLTL